MKVNSDQLRIQASNYDIETGAVLEPEEKPAERILRIDAPMTGNLDGLVHGQMKASINVQKPVHEFANGLRSLCAICKHFDHGAWMKFKDKLTISKEGVQTLNGVRAAVIETGNAEINPMDDDLDVEQALSYLGVCHALTEDRHDVIIVHPESGCPPEYCSPANPSGLFESKNIETEKIGSAMFDQVMRNAQNKVK